MPTRFPRPARARRFRLRAGSRYPSPFGSGRYGAQRYAGGSSLTRRTMLGAITVVGLGGVAELVRALAGSTTTKAATLTEAGGRTRIGSPRPTGPAGATTTPTTSSPATHSATPSHPAHSVTPTHTHSHGSASPHAGHGHQQKKRKDPPAKLPPAKLKVRDRPAYQVSDLVPHPPKHAVALTIDDGPDPLYTPHVLRLLDHYGLQASFCVVGEHAAAYPRLVRDVVRAGHVVVNHSYTHAQPFAVLPQKRIVWEITKTQHAIEQASGFTPELFRSPGGDWSAFIFRALAAYGLEPLDWDVDPRDWAMPGTKRIERRMLQARPGEIVLCHDGGGDRSETVRALAKVLPTWKRRGYTTMPLHVTPHYLTPPGTPRNSPNSHPTGSQSSSATPTTGPSH